MAKITIDQERCKGCLLCLNFCPKKLIVLDAHLSQRGVKPVRFVGGSGCLGCTLCAVICPDCCVEVYK